MGYQRQEMAEAAQKNRERKAKQEERLRKYCDGTRTLAEVGMLVGMKPEAVRDAAKRLGLDYRRGKAHEL